MLSLKQRRFDVSRATYLYTGKLSYFDDSLNGISSLFNPSQATTALKGAVCDGDAVVVKVAPIAGCVVSSAPPGGHYVLVKGEHDDASGNPHFDIVDPGCVNGITSLDAYHNLFEIRGVVADPTDVSTLEILTDSAADLLVTDRSGNQTGLKIKQIPRSSYAQDFLTDNTTGLQATGITHSINLFEPSPGLYSIAVTGLQTGTYSVSIIPYSSDGATQARLTMVGVSPVGVTSSYQIQYSPVPGSAPQLSLSPSSPGAVPPSQVSTTALGLGYSRVSQTFNGTVTITNMGSSTINGPFQIVLTSLTSGVTMANATNTFSGMPYLTVPTVASLAPGHSATVTVEFRNPSNALINFTPVVYSGSLN